MLKLNQQPVAESLNGTSLWTKFIKRWFPHLLPVYVPVRCCEQEEAIERYSRMKRLNEFRK